MSQAAHLDDNVSAEADTGLGGIMLTAVGVKAVGETGRYVRIYLEPETVDALILFIAQLRGGRIIEDGEPI